MKRNSLLPKTLAVFLSFILSLPSSAFALRQAGVEADSTRDDLLKAFNRSAPAAGAEDLPLASRKVLESVRDNGILSPVEMQARGISFIGSGDSKSGPPRAVSSMSLLLVNPSAANGATAEKAAYDINFGAVQILMERRRDKDQDLTRWTEDRLKPELEVRAHSGVIFLFNLDLLSEQDRATIQSFYSFRDTNELNTLPVYEMLIRQPVLMSAVERILVPEGLVPLAEQVYGAGKLIPVRDRSPRPILIARHRKEGGFELPAKRTLELSVPDYEGAIAAYLDGRHHGIRGERIGQFALSLPVPSDFTPQDGSAAPAAGAEDGDSANWMRTRLAGQFALFDRLYTSRMPGQGSLRVLKDLTGGVSIVPEGVSYRLDWVSGAINRDAKFQLPVAVSENGPDGTQVVILGERDAVLIPRRGEPEVVLASADHRFCVFGHARGMGEDGIPWQIQWHFLRPLEAILTGRAQLSVAAFERSLPALLKGMPDGHRLTGIQVTLSPREDMAPFLDPKRLLSVWKSFGISSVTVIPRSQGTQISTVANSSGVGFLLHPDKLESLGGVDAGSLADNRVHFLTWDWNHLKTGTLPTLDISAAGTEEGALRSRADVLQTAADQLQKVLSARFPDKPISWDLLYSSLVGLKDAKGKLVAKTLSQDRMITWLNQGQPVPAGARKERLSSERLKVLDWDLTYSDAVIEGLLEAAGEKKALSAKALGVSLEPFPEDDRKIQSFARQTAILLGLTPNAAGAEQPAQGKGDVPVSPVGWEDRLLRVFSRGFGILEPELRDRLTRSDLLAFAMREAPLAPLFDFYAKVLGVGLQPKVRDQMAQELEQLPPVPSQWTAPVSIQEAYGALIQSPDWDEFMRRLEAFEGITYQLLGQVPAEETQLSRPLERLVEPIFYTVSQAGVLRKTAERVIAAVEAPNSRERAQSLVYWTRIPSLRSINQWLIDRGIFFYQDRARYLAEFNRTVQSALHADAFVDGQGGQPLAWWVSTTGAQGSLAWVAARAAHEYLHTELFIRGPSWWHQDRKHPYADWITMAGQLAVQEWMLSETREAPSPSVRWSGVPGIGPAGVAWLFQEGQRLADRPEAWEGGFRSLEFLPPVGVRYAQGVFLAGIADGIGRAIVGQSPQFNPRERALRFIGWYAFRAKGPSIAELVRIAAEFRELPENSPAAGTEETVQEQVNKLLTPIALMTDEARQEALEKLRQIGPEAYDPLIEALKERPTRERANWILPTGASIALKNLASKLSADEKLRAVSGLQEILSIQELRRLRKMDPKMERHPHTWLSWVLPAAIRALQVLEPRMAKDALFRLKRDMAKERGPLAAVVDKALENVSAAGAEERRATFAEARELVDGFRSVSARDSRPVVVIGPDVAQRFPGFQVLAGMEDRVVIDRGDLSDTLMRVAQRGDAVYFYGDAGRGRQMQELAQRAGMEGISFVLRDPAIYSSDRLALWQILLDLQISPDAISAGFDALAAGLEQLGEAA